MNQFHRIFEHLKNLLSSGGFEVIEITYTSKFCKITVIDSHSGSSYNIKVKLSK